MNGDIPAPNMRIVAATTPGISRNLSIDQQATPPQGGGDLNGTQATVFFHQSGTAGNRVALPRTVAGNYCGVI